MPTSTNASTSATPAPTPMRPGTSPQPASENRRAHISRDSPDSATSTGAMGAAVDANPDEADTGGQYSYDDDFSFGDGDAVILDEDGDESEEDPIILEDDPGVIAEDSETADEPEEETVEPAREPTENSHEEDMTAEDDDQTADDGEQEAEEEHDTSPDDGMGMGLGSDAGDEKPANEPAETAESRNADRHAKHLFGGMFARKPSPGGGGKGGGFKERLSGFTAKLRSEIGDGDQSDDEPPDRGQGLTAEPDEPDEKPEKQGRGKTGRSHHPLRKARDVFFKLSRTRRRLYVIGSIIACLLGVWTVPNLHAAFNPSSSSFEENEGTVKVADPKYADNHVSFKATNDSDMIAHISVKGMVKAWSPRPMWPSSLFAPRTIMGCGQTSMDINPGASKTITMECHGGDGIWKRPAIEVISG